MFPRNEWKWLIFVFSELALISSDLSSGKTINSVKHRKVFTPPSRSRTTQNSSFIMEVVTVFTRVNVIFLYPVGVKFNPLSKSNMLKSMLTLPANLCPLTTCNSRLPTQNKQTYTLLVLIQRISVPHDHSTANVILCDVISVQVQNSSSNTRCQANTSELSENSSIKFTVFDETGIVPREILHPIFWLPVLHDMWNNDKIQHWELHFVIAALTLSSPAVRVLLATVILRLARNSGMHDR